MKRAKESSLNIQRRKHNIPVSDPVVCELCNFECIDSDEFVLHCKKDPNHVQLQRQFLDESYDQIFEQLDRQAREREEANKREGLDVCSYVK